MLEDQVPIQADLIIGSVKGRNRISGFEHCVGPFVDAMRDEFARVFGPHRTVRVDFDFQPSDVSIEDRPEFTIDLTFFMNDNRLDCTACATAFRTNRRLSVVRETIATLKSTRSGITAQFLPFANHVVATLWRTLALDPTAAVTLSVAAFNTNPDDRPSRVTDGIWSAKHAGF